MTAEDVQAIPAGLEMDRRVDEALGNSGGFLPKANFSTSWAGAGLVLDEARARGVYLTVEPRVSHWTCSAWIWHGAGLKARWERLNLECCASETGPLAICRQLLLSSRALAPAGAGGSS